MLVVSTDIINDTNTIKTNTKKLYEMYRTFFYGKTPIITNHIPSNIIHLLCSIIVENIKMPPYFWRYNMFMLLLGMFRVDGIAIEYRYGTVHRNNSVHW